MLPKPIFNPEDVKMMTPGGEIEPGAPGGDFDPASESDEDSEENKRLKRAMRERSDLSTKRGRLAVPTVGIVDADNILKNDVTVRLCILPSSMALLTSQVHGVR